MIISEVIEKLQKIHSTFGDTEVYISFIVTQKMVGRRVALFLAIETKSKDKGPNKDQKNFLFQVKNAGGLSGVAKNETDAAEILDSYYS